MAEDPANSAGKQRGRPFKRGVSGNPGGKARGTRHRATQMAETLMQGELQSVVRAVTSAAIGGDMTAAKLVLERLLPARRDRPVSLALPPIASAADIMQAMSAVTSAIASGTITPTEGAAVAGVLEAGRRAIETADLAQRVAALEAANGQHGGER